MVHLSFSRPIVLGKCTFCTISLYSSVIIFKEIVIDGVLSAGGMASFADVVTPEDAENIRQYIISRANIDREAAQQVSSSAGG